MPRCLALSTLLLVVSLTARADVPGPRPKCDADGMGCTSCWQPYGSSAERQEAFSACRAPLLAKGLVEGCRHRQGAGDEVYFCPPGKKPRLTACAVDGGGVGEGVLPTVAVALFVLVLAHRRSRHTTGG